MFDEFFFAKLFEFFTFENRACVFWKQRILLGIPFAAINFFKNSITVSVVGFGKISAFGHPELSFTNTNKYFFLVVRVLKWCHKI